MTPHNISDFSVELIELNFISASGQLISNCPPGAATGRLDGQSAVKSNTCAAKTKEVNKGHTHRR